MRVPRSAKKEGLDSPNWLCSHIFIRHDIQPPFSGYEDRLIELTVGLWPEREREKREREREEQRARIDQVYVVDVNVH